MISLVTNCSVEGQESCDRIQATLEVFSVLGSTFPSLPVALAPSPAFPNPLSCTLILLSCPLSVIPLRVPNPISIPVCPGAFFHLLSCFPLCPLSPPCSLSPVPYPRRVPYPLSPVSYPFRGPCSLSSTLTLSLIPSFSPFPRLKTGESWIEAKPGGVQGLHRGLPEVWGTSAGDDVLRLLVRRVVSWRDTIAFAFDLDPLPPPYLRTPGRKKLPYFLGSIIMMIIIIFTCSYHTLMPINIRLCEG